MDICEYCQESFSRIGSHWRYNPDHRPELTKEQKEITTGVLMGDGWIHTQDKTPSLKIKSITKDYLDWLNEQFGVLGTSVRLEASAKESARRARDTGFSPEADGKNYSDIYKWNTRCHPEFKIFSKWYNSGKKVWPDNIQLTPLVLKNLYCCDGMFDNYGTNHRIRITCCNESKNREKVEKMFSRAGFEIQRWDESTMNTTKYPDKLNTKITFSASTSRKMFEYMGEPLPGFEYKWPDRFNRDATQ